MILRNFLFLDTDTIGDYLSTLEGYILDASTDQTETTTNTNSNLLETDVVQRGDTIEQSSEMRERRIRTPAAQFQRLYSLLEKQGMIRLLDTFDASTWNNIRRGDILEVQASIRLPKMLLAARVADDLGSLLDLMKSMGQDLITDPQQQTAFEGMRSIGKITAEQAIPLIFTAAGTRGYNFVAHLPRQFARTTIQDLEGEAVVFGKVQRILMKGQSVEAFSLIPGLTSDSVLNRSQKRKMSKSKPPQEVIESIKGPAIVLTPVAVYR